MGRSNLLLAAAAGTAALAAGGVSRAATIAYTSLDASSSHVWVMRGDGSEKDQLTSGAVVDVAPSLSPRGTRLAFVRRLPGDHDDLFRIGVGGTGRLRLTNTAVAEGRPVWAPGGGLIAFEAGNARGSFERRDPRIGVRLGRRAVSRESRARADAPSPPCDGP